MLKTFVMSLCIGAISALLGWTGAVLLENAMSDETFDSLQFGWPGLLIGSIGIVLMFMLIATHDSVEPLMTILVGIGGTVLLWSRRELPFENQQSFQGTPTYYWATLVMMGLVLLLLVLGLRAARVSNQRARPTSSH